MNDEIKSTPFVPSAVPGTSQNVENHSQISQQAANQSLNGGGLPVNWRRDDVPYPADPKRDADAPPPPAATQPCLPIDANPARYSKRMLLGLTDPPALPVESAQIVPHAGHYSVFDDLNEFQQDAIADLLQHHPYQTVIQTLACPEPIGLDLIVSESALRRFHNRWKKKQLRRELDEARQLSQQLRSGSDETIDQANSRLLKLRLLDETTAPAFNPDRARKLTQTLRDLASIEIAKSRLALAAKIAARKLE